MKLWKKILISMIGFVLTVAFSLHLLITGENYFGIWVWDFIICSIILMITPWIIKKR